MKTMIRVLYRIRNLSDQVLAMIESMGCCALAQFPSSAPTRKAKDELYLNVRLQ